MALTKTAVDKAQPKAKKFWLWDGVIPGFGLMVLPSGVKTYWLRYYTKAGVQRMTKVGRATSIDLQTAKSIAREILSAVDQGRDPEQERKEGRTAPDLRELGVRYLEEHASQKRSGFNDEILWRRHLLPELGSTRVASLSRDQVRLFHSRHPRPVTANRALEVLSKAMDLAEDWGWRPAGSNPCQGIKAHPEKKRRRYLDESELRRLHAALVDLEQQHQPESVRWRFAQMIRLLMLTGARLREIMEAEWAWVDWDLGLLVVPPESHKTGEDLEPKDIVLSEDAQAIMRKLHEHRISDQWVVAGALKNRPLNGYRKMWLALLEAAEIQDFRLHDLRHTFASYGISEGFSLEVVGALLGHKSPQSTARYAHLVKREAMKAARAIGQSLS